MELITEGLKGAFSYLISGENEIYQITFLSLRIAFLSTLISSAIGIPFGILLGVKKFKGQKFLLLLNNTGLALPPTVAGLFIAILLWRTGPLGNLRLIYTPTAIVIAEVFLTIPIITSLVASTVAEKKNKVHELLLSLGADKSQYVWLLIREIRISVITAILLGFGRAISEVGAAMIVGGNIAGQTRTLTTAIVLEVSKGQFDKALAISFILLAIVFSLTALAMKLQKIED